MSDFKQNEVLSIQSTVVYGFVGNKCATFTLQVLGFSVSPINSVQLSNHTGYQAFQGQVLNADDVECLYEGLKKNNINNFSHLLTELTMIIKSALCKKSNPGRILMIHVSLVQSVHHQLLAQYVPVGYIGSKSFLEKVADIIKDLRSANSALVYDAVTVNIPNPQANHVSDSASVDVPKDDAIETEDPSNAKKEKPF